MVPRLNRRIADVESAPLKEDIPLSQTTKAPKKGVSRKGANDALLASILTTLDADKAEDVVSIPLKGKSQIADHMVVCSGRSTRQVSALADKLTEMLKRDMDTFARLEGKDQGDWVLVDAGDVIVHIFRPEVREFYQLEKLWMEPGPTPENP